MGMDPIKIGEFREYLRVTRALLHGKEIDYTLNGETRDIKFLHQDDGFINVESPVPIYVAADGLLLCKPQVFTGMVEFVHIINQKRYLKIASKQSNWGQEKPKEFCQKHSIQRC